MYGVPTGNSEEGSTESNAAATLPVALEMTKVAAETPPDLTARHEATTVNAPASRASIWPLGGDRGGVGYGWKVDCGLDMVKLELCHAVARC